VQDSRFTGSLEAFHLSRSFHGRRVVDNVSLVLRSGEIVGLLGPNGAGKTVTFSMIAGLIEPHGGCIVLDGVDITRLAMHKRARRGLVYLPQERSLFHGLTAEDNARSLALEPRFLLFDEPFAGVDPLVVESLHGILLDLRSRGIGILLTDHNVREALSPCDRAYVLFDGKVLAEGTSNELIASEAVRRHFLGEAFVGADRTGASLQRAPMAPSAPASFR
jgi:lipopolysaccharide export system ATP-binding protein